MKKKFTLFLLLSLSAVTCVQIKAQDTNNNNVVDDDFDDEIESLFDDLGGMEPPPAPQPASASTAFFRKLGLTVLMRGIACKRWCIDSVCTVVDRIKSVVKK